MKQIEKTLQNLINNLRELKDISIESDDLTPEQLQYVQEGYYQGLCSAALLIADELDAETDCEQGYLEQEEEWWNNEMWEDITETDSDYCECD